MDSTVAQRFFQPLLLLLAQATDKQLASYLQYLKTENRILRSRLPKRITVTPAERKGLLKVGKPLGRAIKDLITIVSPRTFARWVSQEKKNPGRPAAAAGKGGRPRKPDEVRALILKLASEGAGSGASRIHGILTNLGVCISDATVRRILQQNGIDPGPKRADSTWKEFLKRHRDTLWACDFFTKNVITKGGIVTFYVLFFIHLKSRRVHVAGMTPAPNGDWMAQQARNLSMYFAETGEFKPTHIIRDRDSKFTEQFCAILENDGIEFKPIPPRSPNLNPFAERWIQSVKRECLDHFIVFGEAHLRYLVESYLDWYHRFRPHQGLKNLRIGVDKPPDPVESLGPDEVVCQERLGGLLKHYERKVA
ncbi:MAG: integrase core domain-containing protein [Planctomycetia bacterium]|nr:integrase core domain-containing protein [Planctomycetia bacterium]